MNLFSWLRNLAFPLRGTLVSAVVMSALLVIVMMVGIIGLPAYLSARKSIRNLWEDIAKQVSETATGQILLYFETAPPMLHFIEELAKEEELSLNNTKAIFDICYSALQANPSFMTLYYAQVDGAFYGVFRLTDRFEGSYRFIGPDGKTRIRTYRIEPGNHWVFEKEEIGDYDPRKRPFWKTGLEHPEGGWTAPYIFATTGAMGYSYVLPQGKNQGCWTVDFQIDHLSRYLQSLNVGKEGTISIVGSDGKIIASSRQKEELVQQAWTAFRYSEETKNFLSVSNKIIYIEKLPQISQIPWSLVTIIPEEDFLIPIRRKVYGSLLLGLIPCFLFLIVSAIFFGRISRRLKRVAWEMEEVGDFSIQFKPGDEKRSMIREVNMMNGSLLKMKIGLFSFAKYVPVDLINKLLDSGRSPELGGEKTEITVLFADLVQFTSLAEHCTGDEIAELLEDFFTHATHEVQQEKGIIDKFMGDAVMALWGAPDPVPHAPLAACRTALKMQKIAASNEKMQHRTGINSGSAMVGNFGSSQRMDFTAVGDAVNIAARFEQLNKRYHTNILIGETTAKSVEQMLLIRPLDWVVLQGRTQPSLVYELLGEKQEIAESVKNGIHLYTEALHAYRERKFKEAALLFDRANASLGGEDTPSIILAGRCRDFIENPPPDDWKGTAPNF